MQNDFILRMIEQFTQALIAIVFRRKAGEHKAAVGPAESHPGAAEHQGVDEAGDDVDQASRPQGSPYGGVQWAG